MKESGEQMDQSRKQIVLTGEQMGQERKLMVETGQVERGRLFWQVNRWTRR